MNPLKVILLIMLLGIVRCYLPPSVVGVCNRDDPELDRCVMAVMGRMKPNILSGDYGNGTKLPSVDPSYLDRLDVHDGANLNASFRNVVVTGARNYQLKKLHFNLQKKTLQLLVTVPKFRMTGKYSMKLKLFMFPIDGEGDYVLDITNVKIFARARYTYEPNENGRKTMRFKPIYLKIKVAGNTRFNMTNLLKNRPELSQAANDALNSSPELILAQAKPGVERFFSKLFTTIANGIMQEATEEEAFPVDRKVIIK